MPNGRFARAIVVRLAGAATLAAMLAATLLAACRESPPPDPRPESDVRRRLVAGRIDTLWTTKLSDSALVSPAFLTTDGVQLYLSDPSARTVHAFDMTTGQARWTTRPDSGGTRPRTITSRHDGGVAFLDDETGVVVAFDRAGREVSRVSSPDVTKADAVCALPDGGYLLAGVNHTADFAVVSNDGHVRRALPTPWSGIHGPIAGSLTLVPSGDGCVAALAYGRGFATYVDSSFRAPSRYVEYFEVPAVNVTVRRALDSTITTSQIDTHRIAAMDASADDSVLAVLFEGETDLRAHVVDFYHLPDGAYLASRRLARRPLAYALGGGVAVALTRGPGSYQLTAWRESIGRTSALSASRTAAGPRTASH
jgi:hypothetical protein